MDLRPTQREPCDMLGAPRNHALSATKCNSSAIFVIYFTNTMYSAFFYISVYKFNWIIINFRNKID